MPNPLKPGRYSFIREPVGDGRRRQCDASGTMPANRREYHMSNSMKARDTRLRRNGNAEALTTALDRAAELLASGPATDASAAAQLDTLAATLVRSGNEQRGATRTRFLELAATVEGIANRLR